MGLIGQTIGQKSLVQFIQNNSTVIQFDASLKEVHSRKSTATKFPIENGDTVSDHVIIEPFDLELTGIITDTPLSGVQQLLTEAATTLTSALIPPVGVVAAGAGYALFKAISNSMSPSVAAYAQLLSLQANAQPFDVLTTLYRYSSMWITNLSAPRDSETGDSLIFTISLTELLLVAPKSVNIAIFSNPGLSANQGDLGQQNVGVPNPIASGQAFTDKGFDALGVAR